MMYLCYIYIDKRNNLKKKVIKLSKYVMYLYKVEPSENMSSKFYQYVDY